MSDCPSTRGPLLVAMVLPLLGLATVATAASPDKKALRADALVVMNATIRVSTGALYCDRYVQPNARLVAAAQRWNERQRAPIERVTAIIAKSGGLSDQEKDASNKTAFATWRNLDASRCDGLLHDIESGALDLDKHADTAPALKRIMGSDAP
jgi:hypothetical protein